MPLYSSISHTGVSNFFYLSQALTSASTSFHRLLHRAMSASSTGPQISSAIQMLSARPRRRRPPGFLPKCEGSPAPDPAAARPAGRAGKSPAAAGLQVGSPVIVVEAPATLKTATAISCLRINDGLVKPGDVGRIVARKPKDVWAVRLAIGTYLIDGKHFQPLDLGGGEGTS